MENLQKFLCSNVKLLNWKNIKPEFLNDNEEMFERCLINSHLPSSYRVQNQKLK